MSTQPASRILLVGGGIVGTAIAYALVRAGAEVLMVDNPQGIDRATPASFGWINANWRNDEQYAKLRRYSASIWHTWQEQVPNLPVHWTGALSLGFPTKAMREYASRSNAAGWTTQMLTQDNIRRLEPEIAQPPKMAVLAEAEGYMEAQRVTDRLRDQLMAHPRFRCCEQHIAAIAQLPFVAQYHEFTYDQIVLAPGAEVGQLLIGAPVYKSSGLLVRSVPLDRQVLHHVVSTPALEILQDTEGHLLCVAVDDLPHPPEDNPYAIAEESIARARKLLGIADLELDTWIIGSRPIPADKHPLIGTVQPRDDLGAPVYMAVTHSGVTLAPGIAELVASELVDGKTRSELEPYRPDRPTAVLREEDIVWTAEDTAKARAELEWEDDYSESDKLLY